MTDPTANAVPLLTTADIVEELERHRDAGVMRQAEEIAELVERRLLIRQARWRAELAATTVPTQMPLVDLTRAIEHLAIAVRTAANRM